MHNEPKIPALRFPGFDGIWTEKKFGEVFSFQSTNSLSRENLNYETGVYRNIHYGDIHKKFHSLFDITKEEVPYINENIALKNVTENFLCKEGDLLFADASEDYDDIGKCIEIVNTNREQIVAGLHTIHARPESFVLVIGFSAHLFKSEKIKSQIKLFAQGIKVLSISPGRLSEIILSLPSLPEQTKIASFLTAVDYRINLLTRRKELLEHYKKGVMQKIFNREFRFKDEGGKEYPEWIESKLGNFLKQEIREIDKPASKYLSIGVKSHGKGTFQKPDSEPDKISMDKLFRVKENDLIVNITFAWEGAIAIVNKKDEMGLVSHRFPTYVFDRTKVISEFFNYIIVSKDFRLILELISPGGAGRNRVLNKRDFLEISWSLPSVNEQKKIASFLSSIDQKISLVSTQLEKMQTWKKGLLQQLFV